MKKNKTGYKGRVGPPPAKAGFWQNFWWNLTNWAVKHKFWQRLGLGLLVFIALSIGSMYGMAQWYISKNKQKPLTIGATFIPSYAQNYDLDPKQTLQAIIDDLGIKHFRLVSYWSNIEKERGTYDWSELDWQMEMARAKGAKVSLALGLRQPRWPECHMPTWAEQLEGNDWYKPLENFLAETVKRYKDNPALESYQLENEYFLKGFGLCQDFSRDRLVSEFNLVKSIDSDKPLIVSMSNNAIGAPIGEPKPDMWAISVYKRVWDGNLTRRYFEYPIPAWYYAFRAGFTELFGDRPVFIHELQAEPWTPGEFGGTKYAPLSEQDKSLDAKRLADRINYGVATGMRTIDLWGVEWWYWRKTIKNDPSIWDTAKTELQKFNF